MTKTTVRSKVRIKTDTQSDPPTEIKFYRANDKPYGVFSNLFRRPSIFEGREFPTAEHAYQAGKARKETVREWLLSAPSPSLVAMAAHGLYTWDIVPNWTEIKFDRMRSVLRAKFSQHGAHKPGFEGCRSRKACGELLRSSYSWPQTAAINTESVKDWPLTYGIR